MHVRDLKQILSDLPDGMRIACAYPGTQDAKTEEGSDFGMTTEVKELTVVNSYHVEHVDNEQGSTEMTLVLSVFEPVDPESITPLQIVRDSVPPPFVLGED